MSLEFKIAVCDDEKFFREYINNLIEDYFLNTTLQLYK